MPYPALHQAEHVSDQIEQLMTNVFNSHLDQVWVEHADVPGTGKINLPKIAPNAFYIAEAVEPKALPACFIIIDRSVHDLKAQNFALQEHTVFVAILAEDKEYNQLTRKMWRYGEALYRTLHDAGIGNMRTLVEEISYSPTYGGTASREDRHFRKDVTARVKARHIDVIP